MMTAHLSPPALPVPRWRAGIIAALVAMLVCAGDLLFWNTEPGASIAVFSVLVTGALIVLHPVSGWSLRKWLFLGLLAATAAQSVIEISPPNVLVLLALLVFLLGEWCFWEAPPGWARWIEGVSALAAAPLRWLDLMDRAGSRALSAGEERRRSVWRVVQILTPALFLTVVFLSLLSKGNAVLGNLVSTIGETIVAWIGGFDLSVPRVLLWIVIGTLATTWLSPKKVKLAHHLWSHSWPEWSRSDANVARWQSFSVLAALNAVFFSANTLDVFYLWSNAALPEGVSYSAYLHSGVGSLIVAVILSAVVLVGIHQQQPEISATRHLRSLSYLWIGQNVILIAGVFLRLKLYVEAYQWSELRVYVGCFLLLVTFGFGALAWKIMRQKTLGWLVVRNFGAVFGLFFVLQFLNVAGWIAEANVDQWRNDPTRALDTHYLKSLGAPAWPALARVMEIRPESVAATEAKGILLKAAGREAARLRVQDWRSTQIRRDVEARRLIHRMPGLVN